MAERPILHARGPHESRAGATPRAWSGIAAPRLGRSSHRHRCSQRRRTSRNSGSPAAMNGQSPGALVHMDAKQLPTFDRSPVTERTTTGVYGRSRPARSRIAELRPAPAIDVRQHLGAPRPHGPLPLVGAAAIRRSEASVLGEAGRSTQGRLLRLRVPRRGPLVGARYRGRGFTRELRPRDPDMRVVVGPHPGDAIRAREAPRARRS